MITVPITTSLVRGGAELESVDGGLRLHRLPLPYRGREADAQLDLVERQPSGIRLAFRTSATAVGLELRTTRVVFKGFARERGAVDVTVDGERHTSHRLSRGNIVELDLANGAPTMTAGDSDLVVVGDLPPGDKLVEFWLPHNEQVDLVSLRASAPVHAINDSRPVWLHHGSSISHGSNAATPLQIWPVVAARLADVQLHNLGFGGSALIDPFMARVMRDAPADVISVKLGINVVNLDAMRARSFAPAVHGFLDTIRDGHPTTPLLLVSPLFAAIHEKTPGPGSIDPAGLQIGEIRFIATGDPAETAQGKLTLEVIRDLLARIVEARSGDPNLHFLSGLELYGPDDAAAHPLPDGLHPDTATHEIIGRRFAERAFGSSGTLRLRPDGS